MLPSRPQAYSMTSELVTDIIGWSIAVLSVVGTLYWNARIDRRKRDEQLRRESQAVRAALRSELLVIHTLCAADVPRSLFPRDAYTAMIGRLGSLSGDELRAVVNAYSEVGRWNASFPSRKEAMFEGIPPIPTELPTAIATALEVLKEPG